MNLGNALKAAREQAGLSQNKAAPKIGTNQPYLCQLEGNKRFPSEDMLKNISKAYKIPVSIIFWMGMEAKDVTPDKREAFKLLKPSIDELIGEIFKEKE